jgi:hypothetical protein
VEAESVIRIGGGRRSAVIMPQPAVEKEKAAEFFFHSFGEE